MRTWQSFMVRYEEQPYQEGFNKLAVFHDADNSFLGDVIPDNPDHLQAFIDALEKGICPVMEGWDVGNGKRADLHGWTDDHNINELIKAFGKTAWLPDAKAISMLAYEESIKAHNESLPDEDYPLTFEEYLLAMLEQSENIRDAGFFEDSYDARRAGYYWLHHYKKWIRYITE